MTEHVVPPPAARLEAGKPLRVWYGVLAGPTAWVLLGSLGWFVTGRACADGTPSWGSLSAGGVRVLLTGLALAALAAGALALVWSLRAWRELAARPSLTHAYGTGVAEYIAFAGVVISGAFLLAIVWSGLPAFMVSVCVGGL